jgi:hypothetical protein
MLLVALEVVEDPVSELVVELGGVLGDVTDVSLELELDVVAELELEELLGGELLVDEPLVDEPLVDEPLVDDPLVDEPLVDELLGVEKVEDPVEPDVLELLVEDLVDEELLDSLPILYVMIMIPYELSVGIPDGG